MSGVAPWSVKGIDPKVREAARDAARRQGLTLGEYLNQALAAHEAAKRPTGETALARPRESLLPQVYEDETGDDFHWPAARGALGRHLDPVANLSQRIDAVERRSQLAITGLDRTVSALDRSMLGLAQRVDEAEVNASDAAEKVVDALIQFRQANEALNRSLKGAEAQANEQRRALEEASDAMREARADLEQRVRNAEHSARAAEASVEEIATRVATADGALDARIAEIEARARSEIATAFAEARAASEELSHLVLSSASEIKDARAQQEMLAQRLVSTEKATRQTVRSALDEARSSAESLSERLELLESNASEQADALHGLEGLRTAQAELIQRIIDCETGARAASQAAVDEVRRLHEELLERITAIEPRESSSAAEEAINALQANLARRLESAENAAQTATAGLRQAAGAAIADLRNAQLALTARVKQLEDAPGSVSEQAGAVSELQGRVRDLAESFSEHRGTTETGVAEVRGAVLSIEESVRRLSERLAQTESTANSAILKLEEKVSSVTGASGETEALRAFLETRLNDLAQATSTTIEDVRLRAAEQITAALANARNEDVDSAIVEVNRRLAAAERRQAQTIEAISVEIKRLSETMDRRLRTLESREQSSSSGDAVREEMESMRRMLEDRFAEIERREAANFERVGGEIGQVAERVATVETASARAIDQIGEQIALVAERFNQRQEQISLDLSDRIVVTEERLNSLVCDMKERVERTEAKEEVAEPETLAAVADRLKVTLQEPIRARPIRAPKSEDDGGFDFFEDEPDAASNSDETHAAEAGDPSHFPNFGEPSRKDQGAQDRVRPERSSGYSWRPLEPETDAAEDGGGLLPSLVTEAEPGAKTREDYLAAARRAALAQAALTRSQKRDAQMGPLAGLRGPGRVVLWGAAGAIAVALSGGLWFLKAQSSEEESALAAPATLGPSAAEAAPLPLDPPFADEASPPDAELDESTLRDTTAQRLAAQNAPARAGPIGPRNDALERAADAGDPVAQYDLALQLLSSNRTGEGANLLRRAADRNLAMAQYRLAKLYERGEGVSRDFGQARRWTERAAAAGNRRAMHDLGVYYAQGTGGASDEQAAFQWFRRAALLGVTDSQYNLGVLFQQGRGIDLNPSEALFWFLVASRQGDGDALAHAQSIETDLAASDGAAVRARAEAFRPYPANTRANGEFGARAWTRPAQ